MRTVCMPSIGMGVAVSQSGMEGSCFVLPGAVIDDLVVQGYASKPELLLLQVVEPASVGDVALAVYGTASATVTLLQTPDVIRALAESLHRWFRRQKAETPGLPFMMRAKGPRGHIEFESDEAPSMEALMQLLTENVWGDAAQPDL